MLFGIALLAAALIAWASAVGIWRLGWRGRLSLGNYDIVASLAMAALGGVFAVLGVNELIHPGITIVRIMP